MLRVIRQQQPLVYFLIGLFLAISLWIFQISIQLAPRLIALDSNTGRVNWISLKPFIGNPAIADQRVFVQNFSESQNHDYRWNLTALNSATGKPEWTFQFDERLNSNSEVPITIAGNTAYVILEKERLMANSILLALDVNTGQLRWKNNGYERYFAANGDRLIILKRGSNEKPVVQALEAQTGKLIWEKQLTFAVESTPGDQDFSLLIDGHDLIVSDRTLFFRGFDQPIYAYDLATQELQYTIDRKDIQKLILVKSTLYGISSDQLSAFDTQTGQEKWSYGHAGSSCEQGAIAPVQQMQIDDKSVYTICEDNQGTWLVALEPTNGERQWIKNVSSLEGITTPFTQHLASNQDTIFIEETSVGNIDNDDPIHITAWSAKDGDYRWRFSLHSDFVIQPLTIDENHLILRDRAPRWQGWFS